MLPLFAPSFEYEADVVTRRGVGYKASGETRRQQLLKISTRSDFNRFALRNIFVKHWKAANFQLEKHMAIKQPLGTKKRKRKKRLCLINERPLLLSVFAALVVNMSNKRQIKKNRSLFLVFRSMPAPEQRPPLTGAGS